MQQSPVSHIAMGRERYFLQDNRRIGCIIILLPSIAAQPIQNLLLCTRENDVDSPSFCIWLFEIECGILIWIVSLIRKKATEIEVNSSINTTI